MLAVFAALSVIFTVLAAPPYIIDVLRRRTKPQRATWFILSVLGLIGFISQAKIGINWSLVFLGLDTAGSILVFLLSIPYGVGGWYLLDKYALAVAAIGVAISIAEDQPVIAIAGIILADLAGTALTIKKVFTHPSSETTVSWLSVGVAAVFGVLAVGKLETQLLIWPIYLVIANFAVPLAQYAGRSRSTAKA
ncbi:MAG TPA: hypothetical protein VFP35_03140 [Candidatus Saccharimonadales bacterium]|nr:hypothetical protein [Candidatus Saccharimonadales bacterium]